jgi:DNA repair exonuclease SbcCD ATPase subunit
MEQGGRASTRATVGVVGLGRAATAAGAAFLGAQGLTSAIQTSIDAATNLQEQTSKSREVFRENSREVEAWSRTTADSFGIARDQALEATGTFGNLFRTVNLGTDDAALMSQRLVELAGDLASFNNASPEDALLALRSGLIGEVEPLRRFGVLLSEARVQQEAMRESGKRTAKELTNQEKTLARYRLILKDTAPAQGDFSRTQENFANQTRILKARLRDLSAELGTVAIPVLNEFVGFLIDGTKAAKDFGNALGDAARRSGGFRLGEILFDAADKLGIVTDETDAYNAALERVNRSLDRMRSSQLIFDSLAEGARNAPDNLERFRPPEEPLPTLRPGATAEQRNQWFDAMIGRRRDRVQDVRTLQGQIDALREIAALIRDRIAVTKDITRRLNLEDDLLDVQRQERALREQIRSNAVEAQRLRADRQREAIERARAEAEERRARLAEQRRRALERVQRQQFGALGLDPLTGGERIPGVRELRDQLGDLKAAVRGTFLDTSATTSLMARIRKVLSGGLGAVGRDVRQKVKEMLDEIDNQLADRQRQRTKFRAVDTSKVLAGLGLNPDQIRELRGRISQIGRDRKTPVRGGGAFGVGIPLARFAPPVTVQSTIMLDGQKVGAGVTRRQQQTARRTASQRGGRTAGQAMGLA